MTSKDRKEFYEISNKELIVDLWIQVSLYSMLISLVLIFCLIQLVRIFNIENFKVINRLLFVLFIIAGISSIILLFLALKYSEDEDYSKYVVVEKDYLKELKKKARRK